MDVKKLINGIGIVIDDEIYDSSANIQKIVNQVELADIPLLKYNSLPSPELVEHLKSIAFLILDWRLVKDEFDDDLITTGISIPDGLVTSNNTSNLEFINMLITKCYSPIFIFTNEDPSEIKELVYKDLSLTEEVPNNFFIQSKSSLEEEGQLIEAIDNWITSNPSVYILKEWEKQYKQGKYDLFTSFYKMSAYWPNILWGVFREDGANQSYELNELLKRNLFSQIKPFEFEDEILKEGSYKVSKQELIKVLEGERYIPSSLIHDGERATGDLFRIEEDGIETYWLNIRAQCDIIRGNNPCLYLLKGSELEKTEEGKYEEFDVRYGTFSEKINNCIVPFIDNGKVIEFKLRELKLKKWNSIKHYKIGKILPPYITRIQQKYSAYHHRQGLSRIPVDAIE